MGDPPPLNVTRSKRRTTHPDLPGHLVYRVYLDGDPIGFVGAAPVADERIWMAWDLDGVPVASCYSDVGRWWEDLRRLIIWWAWGDVTRDTPRLS